jgi:hypothetical protein
MNTENEECNEGHVGITKRQDKIIAENAALLIGSGGSLRPHTLA